MRCIKYSLNALFGWSENRKKLSKKEKNKKVES